MIKWLLYLIPDILFMFICYLVNPFVALLVKADGYLPKWLSWFGTHDNPADGDEYFKNKYPGNTWFLRYRRTVFWLYRNTGYTFRYKILGYDMKAQDYKVIHNIKQNNFQFLLAWDTSKDWHNRGWSFYIEIPYGYKNYALRAYLGWKFKGLSSGQKMLAHNIYPFYKVK